MSEQASVWAETSPVNYKRVWELVNEPGKVGKRARATLEHRPLNELLLATQGAQNCIRDQMIEEAKSILERDAEEPPCTSEDQQQARNAAVAEARRILEEKGC